MTEAEQVDPVENEPEEIEEIVPNSVPILKMVKGETILIFFNSKADLEHSINV